MDWFEDMNAVRAQMTANGQQARLMAEDSDKVIVGHFYTVSRNFSSGDGSWCDCFWEVISINGANALVTIHTKHGENETRFWPMEDRAWYLADDAYKLVNINQD